MSAKTAYLRLLEPEARSSEFVLKQKSEPLTSRAHSSYRILAKEYVYNSVEVGYQRYHKRLDRAIVRQVKYILVKDFEVSPIRS